MLPTLYAGVLLVMIGAILLSRDRVLATWWIFSFCLLFGATSVATLSALGGSSLSFPQAGFILLACVAFLGVGLKDQDATRRAFQTHWLAFAIIGYTIIISMFGPRLFEGKIDLINMRPDMLDGVAVATPLRPRPSNITTVFYLAGSFLCAIAVSILFMRRLQPSQFCNAMFAVGLGHAALGLIDAAGVAVGQGRVLDFLRNANIMMVDQQIGDVRRLSGSLSEPSSYAGFAVPFAVFATEYWLRTRNGLAGLTSLLLWAMVLASTSSAGIFGFSVYAILAVPRFVISPVGLKTKLIAAAVVVALVLIGTAISLAFPPIYVATRDFVLLLTVQKSDSQSAVERGTWARQGWLALQASFGLGTGAGSFRSSSFPMAVLGSLGVIGSALVAAYITQVARPVMDRRFGAAEKAAAWAAIFQLVPGIVGGSSPDPGFLFGLFAGYALHPVVLATARRGAGPPRTSSADLTPSRAG